MFISKLQRWWGRGCRRAHARSLQRSKRLWQQCTSPGRVSVNSTVFRPYSTKLSSWLSSLWRVMLLYHEMQLLEVVLFLGLSEIEHDRTRCSCACKVIEDWEIQEAETCRTNHWTIYPQMKSNCFMLHVAYPLQLGSKGSFQDHPSTVQYLSWTMVTIANLHLTGLTGTTTAASNSKASLPRRVHTKPQCRAIFTL